MGAYNEPMILQAIILGIVEGLTEFLPISSTGHLIVAENMLGYHDSAKLFTIVVQLGAILAVAWHYKDDLIKRVRALIAKEKAAKSFWTNLVIATLPAGIVGLLLEKTFEKIALPSTVAVALIVGAGVIFWAEARFGPATRDREVKLDQITRKQALQVGLAQVVALVPGVSRSGATIIGGMAVGINRVTAVTFSFYMGLPVLGLASLYKLLKNRNQIAQLPGGGVALIMGTLAAFVSATIVIKWLLKYVAHNDFRAFGYYRLYLGILLLILVALRVVSNTA